MAMQELLGTSGREWRCQERRPMRPEELWDTGVDSKAGGQRVTYILWWGSRTVGHTCGQWGTFVVTGSYGQMAGQEAGAGKTWFSWLFFLSILLVYFSFSESQNLVPEQEYHLRMWEFPETESGESLVCPLRHVDHDGLKKNAKDTFHTLDTLKQWRTAKTSSLAGSNIPRMKR